MSIFNEDKSGNTNFEIKILMNNINKLQEGKKFIDVKKINLQEEGNKDKPIIKPMSINDSGYLPVSNLSSRKEYKNFEKPIDKFTEKNVADTQDKVFKEKVFLKERVGNKSDSRKIFINQSNKNKRKYSYLNNFVTTSKYTIYDFLPFSLLLQFKRYANIYFLCIAVLQSIPAISPMNASTAIAPLVFVLFISIIREGLEDYERHVSDQHENEDKVLIYQGNGFKTDLSKNIEVGDIIKVNEYGIVPADFILLACNNLSKIAYIETANLDGEKNLKPKFCIPNVYSIYKDGENECIRTRGKIICDKPKSDLNNFIGRLRLSSKNEFSLGIKQFLFKGTILKNTKWAIGVVLYTGKESKIVLNSQKGQGKQSHLEEFVNYLIGFIFISQLIICVILGALNSGWNSYYLVNENSYIGKRENSALSGLIAFFSYLLLLNTMIPISLIVTIEMVKYFQGYFMNNDVKMFSNAKDKFVKVNSCSLNEELGQIKYIFSDKTGTLTANKLEFKAAVIGHEIYGVNEKMEELHRRETYKSGGKGQLYIYSFPTDQIKKFITQTGRSYENVYIPSSTGVVQLKIENQKDIVEHYLYNLSVNQTCFVEIKKPKQKVTNRHKSLKNDLNNIMNKDRVETMIPLKEVAENPENVSENINSIFDITSIQYKGENPDEIIFVDTARHLGFVYLGGDDTVANLKIMRGENGTNFGENIQIEILKILEFSSTRGMMSTIVRHHNKLFLYSKGGDKKINALLSTKFPQPFLLNVKEKALKLSEKGLRVLWIAMKMIDESEFNQWNMDFEYGLKNLTQEDEINEFKYLHYKTIENGLILIGCTAVEDKLQENVPEVIKEMQTAGINVWVLTGDNLATARNIGIMCKLLPNEMEIYEINDDINKFKEKVNPDNDPQIFTEDAIKIARMKIKKFEDKHREVYLETNTEEYLCKKSIILVGLEKMLANYRQSEIRNQSTLRGILVESEMLRMLLPNENYMDVKYYGHPLAKYFLDLTLNSQAVVCCRVAPKQKALVVRMIKKNIVGAITLSIGDGANDVSMIKEADVGIGIFGEEGTQAAMSSDYAIGEFQCLRRLVLYHGRLNYLRIAEMIIYFFYKNFIFTIPQLLFAFYSAFSGQTVFDDYFISFYNLFFTALPLLFKALLEQDLIDLSEEYPEKKLKFQTDTMKGYISNHIPYTYYKGRESLLFNFNIFFDSITVAFLHSFLVFFSIEYFFFQTTLTYDGFTSDIWTISEVQFTSIILMVNYRLLVTQRHNTSWNNWIIILTSYLVYFLYLVVSSYLSFSKTYSTVTALLSFPQFYLSIFLISTITFLIDLIMYSYNHNFIDEPVNLLRRFAKEAQESNDEKLYEKSIQCRNQILEFDKNVHEKFKVKRVEINDE